MESPLQQKSRTFAIRIINCYKFLTEQKHEMVMSKQLLRSGTSIGANTRESKNAQSRMDFLNKLNIALKEADEVTEQRAQSHTCMSYVESRRNSTKVKQSIGWIYSMKRNILMTICTNPSMMTVLSSSRYSLR